MPMAKIPGTMYCSSTCGDTAGFMFMFAHGSQRSLLLRGLPSHGRDTAVTVHTMATCEACGYARCQMQRGLTVRQSCSKRRYVMQGPGTATNWTGNRIAVRWTCVVDGAATVKVAASTTLFLSFIGRVIAQPCAHPHCQC